MTWVISSLWFVLLAMMAQKGYQQSGVCYRQVATYYPRSQYHRGATAVVSHYYNCNWGCRGRWSVRCGYARCTAYRTSYHQAFSGYVTGTRYHSQAVCCSGYAGAAPNCQAICSQGCFNNGVCNSPGNCVCATGWTGRDCRTDIDECSAGTDTCSQVCVNDFGSYHCECYNGYNKVARSDTDIDCNDINECQGDHNCDHNCSNSEGSYACTCNEGYLLQSDGRSCEDINECIDDNGGCGHICDNTLGSYSCSCNDGFQLDEDKHNCSDIMECSNNGLHNCDQICIELEGNFQCACNDGYELAEDNATCSDINECEVGLSGCTQNCTNTDGSFVCSCLSGYSVDEEDQKTCLDINECETNNGECEQICINTEGSYSCRCLDGYTLKEDSGECIAQPCPTLMMPSNGNISCNGTQTTGNMCYFTCDDGYAITGSYERYCLPSNEWSGNSTDCEILQCNTLQNPENGGIILPCGKNYGTICNIQCSDGFYSDSPNPVQVCHLVSNNTVEWSEPPKCEEIEACTPNPCQHGGMCTVNEDRSFTCDCAGTMYTGINCENGIISVPVYPSLITNIQYSFVVTAKPDKNLILTMLPDDRSAVIVNPQSVEFTQNINSHNFTMESKRSGLFKLNYRISGASASRFKLPQPSSVIAIENDTDESNSMEYFESRGLPYGLLQAGCCTPPAFFLEYGCPSGSGIVRFNATCAWNQKGLHSIGIVFSDNNGFGLPVAIAGIRFDLNFGLISLSTFELRDPCNKCTQGLGRTDDVVGLSTEECEQFKPSITDIRLFLDSEALAFTYLYYSNQLLPQWLKLNVTQSMRLHDSKSYRVTLAKSSEIEKVEGCNFTEVYSDGLYSVLMYSGILNVSVNLEEFIHTSQIHPVCFAVNLCEGKSSPLYISIPPDASDILSNFVFMDILKLWNITLYSISVTSNTITTEMYEGTYWNGIGNHILKLKNYNLVLSNGISYSHPIKDYHIDFSFTGTTYLSNNDIETIFSRGLESSWIGFMVGNMELSIKLLINGTQMSLTLSDNTNQHILLTGDSYTPRACENCNNSAGIALKLFFYPNQNTNGFFTQLLKVPPKEEFGLPTQFSCPVDVFVFLDEALTVEASIYKSTCLGLHLGLFPFEDLENVIYIFNECFINSYCNHHDFANKANLIIWSYLTEPSLKIDMGFFMKLFPASHRNKSAIVTTFSGETYDIRSQLLNIQFSIFDTVVNSTAFIDKHKLTSKFLINLYNKYPTEVKITVSQVSSWDQSSISVHGTYMHLPHNIPSKLASYINVYLSTVHTRALMKIKNAESVYDNALSQQLSATETFMQQNSSKFLNDLMYQAVSDELNDQVILVRNITDELQEANEDVRELRERIDNICMIQTCEEICVPSLNCTSCERQVSALIQGDCTVECEESVTVTEVVRYELKYRWEYIPRRYCGFRVRCLLWILPPCFVSVGCRTRGVCVRLSYLEPIFETRTFTVRTLCTRPCPANLIEAPVMDECCANVGCERYQQNRACASENEQCSAIRNRIYGQLASEQDAAAVLLRRYDEANERETALKLQLAQLNIRKNNIDKRFNESEESLADAMSAVELASSTYEKIRKISKLDQLERLKKTMDNISSFDVVNITNVTFNTVIISESPTILQLHFNGDIAHIGYTFFQKITVDFDRLEMSLREAAIAITENSILNKTTHSKRSSKYRRQDNQPSDGNYLHFQAKCTDLQNIIEYVKEINKSLALLENVTDESVNNAINNKKEINNLIDEYTTIYKQPITINMENLNKEFNISIDGPEQTQVSGFSIEEELNLNLLKEYLNGSKDIEGNMGKRLLTIWRNKMDELHNMTSSAAGHECIGFSDCLQEVLQVLEDLLLDSPSIISEKLLQHFSTVSQNFLSLSLLKNDTFASVIKKLNNFHMIAADVAFVEYWCATPPVIIEHPVRRINPHENMTIELSCKTVSDEFTMYRWKKDGIELPNQKHSTLVLHNAKRQNSGNYTCEVTNHVGTVKSTGAIVDVQQLPWFFLQPQNIDVYTGDPNGAVITSNATGWPYPGFRWYFKPKNGTNFTQVPNEDENELVISNPHQENEGLYYCEAFNEQGITKSVVANLTVLDVTVAQLSQSFSINFTSIELFSGSGSTNESENVYSGSGANDMSGSGIEQTTLESNSSSEFQSRTELQNIESQINKTLSMIINFNDNTVENISVLSHSNNTMLLSFTVYSKNFAYSETSVENLNQLVVLAQADWFEITRRVRDLLTSTSIVITSGDTIYSSEPNSTIIWFPQNSCPPGKAISSSNTFLCVNCAPGSYQAIETVLIEIENNTSILNPICVPCQMGYYQNAQGQVACTACPAGYTTRNTSSHLPEDCYKECDKGYYSSNGLEPCSRCPNGTYSPESGLTMCISCTQFNYTITGYCDIPKRLDPCNSRCEHRCITRTKKCSCRSGYVLASNGFSCLECASVEDDVISPLWHVAICNDSNTTLPLVCSGSLLNDQWVLTSASCVCNIKNKSDIVVRSGKVHTCNLIESEETEHAIEAIFCYSDFNSTFITSDLALIKMNLHHSVIEMQNIRPVCLNYGRRRRSVKQNDQVTFFGWGNIAQTASSISVLNKSISTVVTKRKCKSSFLKENVIKIDNSVFCTMGSVSNACAGNPGSGVVVGNRNTRLLLQGVISRSTNICGMSESVIAHSKVQTKAVQKWIKKTFKH